MMEYKGYVGVVEFDDEARLLHGEVINTRDVITFQAKSVDKIYRAFQESIDDYLDFCRSRNEKPEKPFSGKFSVRLEPDLHRRIYARAKRERKSLNSWITDTLASAATR